MASSMLGQGYKGDIVFDATTGLPNGVQNAAEASIMDGVVGALTRPFQPNAFLTGLPNTVAHLLPIGASVLVTSKVTTGSWIPRKAI